MTAATIDRLLAEVRTRIVRLAPRAAHEAVRSGSLLLDLRPSELRAVDGEVPGAVHVSRHVLEWRLDPTSPHRLDGVTGPDTPIVLLCTEGYTSSLAADVCARQLGLRRVADVVGGIHAWRAAGLPWRPGAEDGPTALAG